MTQSKKGGAQNSNNGNENSSHAVAIGVGIAAIAAAAAGAYYLYGNEQGPKRRKQMKSWMLRMKAEAMEEIEKLKDVNKDAYENVIATITEKYKHLKDVDPVEVMALASQMKTHWKNIQKDLKSATKPKAKTLAKRKTSAKRR